MKKNTAYFTYIHFRNKRQAVVWIKSSTTWDVHNVSSTVKHGGGGVLYVEAKYERKCCEIGVAREFYFQQENDPKHTVAVVLLRLIYNASTYHTPPQFPELNPIEHL